jgi:hypothetical protein
MAQPHGRSLAFYIGRWHCVALTVAVDAHEMKAEELFRNMPTTIAELQLSLAGLPNEMKVKADPETGIFENTVDELRARTTWPPGLVITTPRKLNPKSVVKINKAAT